MGEPKPLASLSSSLLARKGQAKPAMRPQGYASFKLASTVQDPHYHDDLGWNDMGPEADQPASVHAFNGNLIPESVEVPAVVQQQQALAEEMEVLAEVSAEPVIAKVQQVETAPAASDEVSTAPTVRAAPGSRGKAAFTLRLDGERHLKLRLVCAVMHRSAQQVVTAALDDYLAAQPAIADLAKSKLTHS
jgi:hypothetical protein